MYFPLVTGPLFVIYKPVQIVTTKQVDKSVLVSFNIRGDENYIIKMMIILAEITQKNRVTPYIIFFFISDGIIYADKNEENSHSDLMPICKIGYLKVN